MIDHFTKCNENSHELYTNCIRENNVLKLNAHNKLRKSIENNQKTQKI